jgi:hypothetical protein
MALLRVLRDRRIAAATLVACLAIAPLSAQAPTPIESNLKAVFLFNFSKYVTWPAIGTGERSPAEVRVCTTANDGFFALLKAAVHGEDVDGRPLVPIALTGLDDARHCQILYVGNSQSLEARAWLGAVRNRQVLTVGDGVLTDDLVIAFVREDNRIRFDINRAAASRNNLNVSSKLLRLARQVRER